VDWTLAARRTMGFSLRREYPGVPATQTGEVKSTRELVASRQERFSKDHVIGGSCKQLFDCYEPSGTILGQGLFNIRYRRGSEHAGAELRCVRKAFAVPP